MPIMVLSPNKPSNAQYMARTVENMKGDHTDLKDFLIKASNTQCIDLIPSP